MAEPTPEQLRLLANGLYLDWEQRLPEVTEEDGEELPSLFRPREVVDLTLLALVRGIEIGRQHPTKTQGN